MKNFLIALIQRLLTVFFLFPIRKNRVFFSAYSGKSYSCNPKYISQFLLDQCGDDLEIIWAFTNPRKERPLDSRVRRVRFKSLAHLYYLLTSRVVVDNVESWSILPKRKGQLVVNTWHGGGAYKGVGLMRRDVTAALNRNMLKKHSRVTLYLSSSRAFSERTLRESFQYAGEILECGMPRNDILLNHEPGIASAIREKLGLGAEIRAALYAPTFRHDERYAYELDTDMVLDALSKRFGGQWVFLFRAHYYRNSAKRDDPRVIDVSDYEDMQEILLVSDVLITDYSSSMWDYSLMYRPAFLFTPDLSTYNRERDFYYPIEEWPYPFARTNEALAELIGRYNEEESIRRIRAHHEKLGACETGCATEAVANVILGELHYQSGDKRDG